MPTCNAMTMPVACGRAVIGVGAFEGVRLLRFVDVWIDRCAYVARGSAPAGLAGSREDAEDAEEVGGFVFDGAPTAMDGR